VLSGRTERAIGYLVDDLVQAGIITKRLVGRRYEINACEVLGDWSWRDSSR